MLAAHPWEAAARDIPSSRPESSVLTVFLIDGLQTASFDEELRNGQLPELGALMASGAHIRSGIGSFPSITGYAYFPFLTGFDATRSGIYGLRWLDRNREEGMFRSYVGRGSHFMNTDVHPVPRLLFEEFPGAMTLATNTFLSRGASALHSSGMQYAFAKYRDFHWFPKLVSRIPKGGRIAPSLEEMEKRVVDQAIKNLSNNPRVQWITLSSPDTFFHLGKSEHGRPDARYGALLRNIDHQIGRYRKASRQTGVESNRVYAVVSDHGGVQVEQNTDPCHDLRGLGLSCYRGKSVIMRKEIFKLPRKAWRSTDIVLAINGNTMAYLYANDGDGFSNRLTTEQLLSFKTLKKRYVPLLHHLLNMRGVEFVVSRDADGSARIQSPSRGQARIVRNPLAQCYRYIPEAEPSGRLGDPLGYGHLWNECLTEERWLNATSETQYPYAIVRIHRLMNAPGSGDIVLTAREGFDFGAGYEALIGNYRGGHGGLQRPQIAVPYILSGPGVAKGVVVNSTRSEDLGATLRWLLGLPLPEGDGAGRLIGEALEF